jgi:hypothetical protein
MRALFVASILGLGTALVFGAAAITATLFPNGAVVNAAWNGGPVMRGGWDGGVVPVPAPIPMPAVEAPMRVGGGVREDNTLQGPEPLPGDIVLEGEPAY